MENIRIANNVGGEDVIFVTNAFSLNMLLKPNACIYAEQINPDIAQRITLKRKVISYIGHEATARALSVLLGRMIPVNREMLKLHEGKIIVFTLNQRLQEGQVVTSEEELTKIGYTLWFVTVR